MNVDPVVSAAADTYVNLPANFGEDTHLIRLAERDAFMAGVAWRDGHPLPPITDEMVEAGAAALDGWANAPVRLALARAILEAARAAS
jgi:hypothetical protein